MRTLILIRHAHAHSSKPPESDFDRKIDTEGRQQAKRIVRVLKDKKITIQKVVVSPAVRAVDTASIICRDLHIDSGLMSNDDRIYRNTIDALLDLVHDLSNDDQQVMLVGHNPGISQLAAFLTGDSYLVLTTGMGCCLFTKKERWCELNFHGAVCDFLINSSSSTVD